MDKKYTFEDFIKIIAVLRAPDGCPWDREQTHMSLRPCLMEEAAEVIAAIRILDRTGNAENLKEELGDVLLQVIMHSQIASEEGLFSLEDVIREICEKMVRRHPHVFGTVKADDSAEVLRNWDEIKKNEKEEKTPTVSPLREIPPEFPALTRGPKVLKKADKLYEKRNTAAQSALILEKQAAALRQELENGEDISALMGKILMEISNIGRDTQISLEQILNDEIENIIDFYEDKFT